MDIEKPPPLKETAARFAQEVSRLANSEVGWKAKWMLAALLALLCAANGLNVLNSYVGRNFITAIAERHMAEFVRQAMFYVAVFAGCTAVAVIAHFLEERLGLLWRDNLTRRTVRLYLANGAYNRLASSGELANRTSGSPKTPGRSRPLRCPFSSWRSTAASRSWPFPACCCQSVRFYPR
jgi:vitamin B12/bleomycin/antimicrobial peptide transport system ATP-binding/permease protein